MTSRGDHQPDTEIAGRVLSQYPIETDSITFLAQSGSMTWRVEDRLGFRYALHVYSPVSSFLSGVWQIPEVVRSEMMWLSHLHDETEIPVQEPLRTKEGDWITLAETDCGQRMPCTLLRWIEGTCHDGLLNERQSELAAMLLARLHVAWLSWSKPADFVRPRYDAEHLMRALAGSEKHVQCNVISSSVFSLFRASVEIVCSMMMDLGESEPNWGLIHGDFAPFNLVFHRDTVSPIDFSESGFGHFLQDLSSCLLRIGPGREIFFETYERNCPLPPDAKRLAEGFCIAHMVHWLAFTSSLPDRYEKVSRIVHQYCEGCCRKFLSGERFLFRG